MAGNELKPAGAFSAFERMVAKRYLRARRRESFISVIAWFSFLGIMLGVATLIIVMSVMNGFRSELLTRILGFNGHIVVRDYYYGPIVEHDALAQSISTVNGVSQVVALIEGQVLLSHADRASGALVRGVAQADLPKIPSIYNGIKRGSIADFDAANKLLIGWRLAERLAVNVGDRITLLAPNGVVTPFGITPQRKDYEIGAIFEIGMSEYDSGFVFMPLAEAQRYFNMEDGVSVLEVMVEDPDELATAQADISELLGPLYQTLDWRQRYSSFFSALQVERNVMFLILSLIVLVAAFNIISGLTMLVKDKSHDIAILRTMGATRAAVMRIFFVTGAAIGVAGTLAGTALGIVFCAYIEEIRQFLQNTFGISLFPADQYFLSELPAEINNTEVMSVIVMALVLSFLAPLFPAWKAARLDPVEALRYE